MFPDIRKLREVGSKIKAANPDEWPGSLGKADGTVDVQDRAGYSYVTDFSGVVYEAWRENLPGLPGLPVMVGSKAGRITILRIWDVFATPPPVPPIREHGQYAHQFPFPGCTPGTGYDWVPVQVRQVMPLRVTVDNATLKVTVEPSYSPILLNNVWLDWAGQEDVDLTSYIPTTGARYVLLYLYNLAGVATLGITAGSVVPFDGLVSSVAPKPAPGQLPIGIIRLYLGQTAIEENSYEFDILDTRIFGLGVSSALDGPYDYIVFNTSYTATGSEAPGTIYWNSDDETFDMVLEDGVTGQAFLELFFDYNNNTGSTITNGSPLMFSGTLGVSGRITAQLAIGDGTIPPEYTIGIATHDCDDGDTGKATWFGKVRHIDTTGTPYSETWADGDLIFVSPDTAGYLTNVRPDAPDRAILIAAVIKAHSNGTLLVRPTWTPKLTELDDVDGGTPTTGDVLAYDGTVWEPNANLKVTDDAATIPSTGAFYLGDPATDGTWRIIRDGDDLSFERLESSVWVSKGLMQA
jgi:hypothetical protein